MDTNQIIDQEIYSAVLRAVTQISGDVRDLLKAALAQESDPTAQSMLSAMTENLEVALAEDKAVCQSPGYPTCWITHGENNFPMGAADAIRRALAESTRRGYLRPSMVDPLTRVNSVINTGIGVPNL